MIELKVMTEPKDAGTLIRLAYQAMLDLEIDAAQVLLRCNIKLDELYDSKLRTPHWAQSVFWEAVEEVSGDPHIGLHIGDKIPSFKGVVLEYLLISAANYAQGIRRIFRYQRLISDAISTRLVEQGDEAYMELSYTDADNIQLIDGTLMAFCRTLFAISDKSLQPIRVDLVHDGIGDVDVYAALFECPVFFAQPENRVYFSPQSLHGRSLHSQPELISLHLQCADEQIADLEREDFIADVQYHIAGLLEGGGATATTVAQAMAISCRKLKDRLEQGSTSFSQVLNDYRQQLATRLLLETDESIAEIVYLTGFAEPSTFYRAFKRWEGVTPIEFRGQSGAEHKQ